MINTQNVLDLADLVEKQPKADASHRDGFTMESFVHDCGSPACIAGWAAFMAIGKDSKEYKRLFVDPEYINSADGMNDLEMTAQDFLGIDRQLATDLFWGNTSPDVTPKEAATTLRNLAETGKVSWGDRDDIERIMEGLTND